MSINKIIEALQESGNMKEFVAVFWRGNPQLKNGGYETERTIEAKTLKAAEKKAKEIEKKVAYGSMSLLRVEEKETVQESPNFKSRLEKIENLANEEVEEGSNFKSRLEKLDKMANESKVTEEDVPDRKQYKVDEDRWVTIKGTHVLINNKGEIKDEKLRKEIEGNTKESNKKEDKKEEKKNVKKKFIENEKDFDSERDNVLKKFGDEYGFSTGEPGARELKRALSKRWKILKKINHYKSRGIDYEDDDDLRMDYMQNIGDIEDSLDYLGISSDREEVERATDKMLKDLGLDG